MENVSSIQILSAQEYLMYSLPRTLHCAIAYAWAQGDVEILIEVFTMEDLRNPSLRIWKLLKRASEVGQPLKSSWINMVVMQEMLKSYPMVK